MSTKIYNAYKVNNMTTDEIMMKLHELREWYFVKINEFLLRVGMERIKKNYGDYTGFLDKLREDSDKLIDRPFNFSSSIMVYFHGGDIYIQFFGMSFPFDHETFFEGNLEDYHYQNQSDPWYDYDGLEGDELKEAEDNYKLREKVWDDILGDRTTFAECGLVFELYKKEDYFRVGYKFWTENNDKENV